MKFNWKSIFEKKENIYLSLALTLGIFMAFFNPPFSGVPDEHAHYWKAWSVAGGYWKCTGEDAIPKSAQELPDQIKPIDIKGVEGEKISLRKIKEALFAKDSNEKVKIGGTVCPSVPVGYAPQVVGLSIGKSLGLSPLADFYIARILNLLTAVFITYLAIKIIPFGKIVLLLVGLLPMTVQQFASLSYDPLHISLAFLFLAYVLRLSSEKNMISSKNILILAALSLVGLNIKLGYFLLTFLVFLLPMKKFKNKNQYWLVTVGLIFANIVLFLLIRGVFQEVGGLKEGTDPSGQLAFVLSNPLNFAVVLFESVYRSFFFYLETFLGKPGWLTDSFPHLLYVLMLLGIATILKNEDEKVDLSFRQRILMLTVFSAMFSLVFLSLYMGWTKVGADRVSGVQGRYFLSIAPILILAFYKSGFTLKSDFIKKNLAYIVPASVFAVFLTVFVSMYGLYYDKSSDESKYVYERMLSTEQVKKAPLISGGRVLRQTFVSEKNYFTGVKVYVSKGTIKNELDFKLKDDSCEDVIDSKKITSDKKELTSIDVKFGIKTGTANKAYCLEISGLSQSDLEPRVIEGKYEKGRLLIDGTEKKEDLVFDVIYKNL